MPILYNDATREFHLQTEKVSYIFSVLENDQLGHLYYGKKLRHRDSFERLFHVEATPNTACVNEEDLVFSLDVIKQEYPAYGTTDFREPAYQVLQEDGSRITNLVYQDHQIFEGKKKLEGLPATYVETEDEATTLEVYLYDKEIDVEVRLSYTVFEQLNAIARSAQFINRGHKDVNLTRAFSASIDLPDSDFEMLQLSGSWARERHIKNRKLVPGTQSISSTRGTSSAQQNPFLALKRPETTEHQGEVYGVSLVYSGNFLAQVEVDHYDVTRLMIGINPFDFNWLLESGESFQTPEVVMVYSTEGLNRLSQTFHRLYRTRLARGQWRDRERPVLINNWEATYFDFDEEKIFELAKSSKELGVELFVLDDGWFGKRDDDTTSLGDWFEDERKLPNGITQLAKDITGLGMEFGLWFEPEMVSKASELYKTHPDWVIHVPNRPMSHGRNQFVLDFSRQEVVDFIHSLMAEVLRDAPISYVKWDMNRYMTEIGSLDLPANRQREVAHRYILGVYSLYERLTTEFPHVLFESCAGGGSRFDPGLLHYAPQGWTSDDTDAVERLKIQYGTSLVYPLSSMGAHVSAVPNHQVGRRTSLETRANVAYFGAFGYELDVTMMTDEEKERVKEQIAFYKKNRALIQQGQFYRIESPFAEDGNITSWMVVSDDQNEAILGYYQVLSRPNPGLTRVFFKGLNPEFEYTIDGIDATFYGDELMGAGLQLNRYRTNEHPADFSSIVYKLKRV
ncbi:alpha-galactosidase [Planococcus antarcticus DSM 14505]|uniref:Alpha-galactosidase n=1 Tax=Planococcus antarcticus DSM 14505 TaxID=1185653 RepID=A0ABN4RJ20_9BACL|nr:alpha-galactosidase [Planococcus antarcticus]ANU11992.1 alpha-galactosidase [Planococcus antarcticus DSM 14505]